jgi:hypothetical protein
MVEEQEEFLPGQQHQEQQIQAAEAEADLVFQIQEELAVQA